MRKLLFVLLAVCSIRSQVSAQTSTPSPTDKVAPLPPNAAELFKYNSIPVSPMTGVPSISYSLYEINTGKIRLPVTLNYHASGIKVNQRATWVGLGWSLSAGGNISRAVRGAPDEKSFDGWFNHHTSIDTIDNIRDYNTLYSWMLYKPDGEPDFFSYNIPGKSGKFLYSRDSAAFVNFPYQPIAIKRIDLTADGILDTYQITDDDGTRYWFGQSQTFNDETDVVQSYVQSWYLTHIISNDSQDTVYFRYNDAALSGRELTDDPTKSFSVMYHWTASSSSQGIWTRNEMVESSRDVFCSPATLSEILFRQGKVVLYSKSPERKDGGNSLDSVVVFAKDAGVYTRVKKIAFNYGYFDAGANTSIYNYRLKLLSFDKVDLSGGQPETYKFEYNNIPLPSIQSYAVDYWGYYNGATSNTSLMQVQKPQGYDLRNFDAHGTAYREPSPAHMIAGILNKVIYPTGGYTSFNYEPNIYTTTNVANKTVTVAALDLYGKGGGIKVQDSKNFIITPPNFATDHPAKLTITFSPFSPNAVETAMEVTLKDLTTGLPVGTGIWSSDAYTANNQFLVPHTDEYTFQFSANHTYMLSVSVQDVTTTRVRAMITTDLPDSTTLTKSGAGIRVSTISTYGTDNVLQKKEQYKYGLNENGVGYMPITGDAAINNNFVDLATVKAELGTVTCSKYPGQRRTYYGSYSYPTVNYQGAAVVYLSVTRYDIDSSGRPNGKTLMQYQAPSDFYRIPAPATPGGNEYIETSTMSDPLLQSEHVYKYNPLDGSYKMQKQTLYTYGGQFPIVRVKGVKMWKNYVYYDQVACNLEIGEYGHRLYELPLIVRRLVETEETNIDDNGNFMVNKVIFHHNRYGYQSSIKTIDSKNDTITNLTFFPGDHTGAVSDAAVLNRMVRRNMIRQPYWQGNYKRNTLLKYNHTVFGDQWAVNDSLIMPKTDTLWILGGTQGSVAVNYQGYDKYGNILQLTERNGITNSFTWNANGTYPLSQTVNATNTSVLYDGFEDAGTWTGVTRDNGQARTGKYAGLITNTGAYVYQRWTSVSLTAVTKFRYSGWVYSNGPAATINLLMKKSGETGTYSYIDNIAVSQSGKWIYVDKEYDVPADVKSMSIRLDNNGTGKVWFDDIRLRPSSSRMATYTYSPLIGVTSKTDENNLMLKYEYDGLGRLKVIRDQDGHVLKQIDYQYQAPLTK
jgi:YD repeat-containing protein